MQPISEATISDAFPGCRVLAFDRPPFGLSERPLEWEEGKEPYSVTGGARLACGLLDTLNIPSALLVGHSMGATVSIEILKMCALWELHHLCAWSSLSFFRCSLNYAWLQRIWYYRSE